MILPCSPLELKFMFKKSSFNSPWICNFIQYITNKDPFCFGNLVISKIRRLLKVLKTLAKMLIWIWCLNLIILCWKKIQSGKKKKLNKLHKGKKNKRIFFFLWSSRNSNDVNSCFFYLVIGEHSKYFTGVNVSWRGMEKNKNANWIHTLVQKILFSEVF